jgi:hypothetical protein
MLPVWLPKPMFVDGGWQTDASCPVRDLKDDRCVIRIRVDIVRPKVAGSPAWIRSRVYATTLSPMSCEPWFADCGWAPSSRSHHGSRLATNPTRSAHTVFHGPMLQIVRGSPTAPCRNAPCFLYGKTFQVLNPACHAALDHHSAKYQSAAGRLG